ncbi:MAG: hypothetical protein GC190_16510 [Alphaproteobacteria bacterium]|nr:hypothetical protein [Alphaproteobacteria bacterium]
MRITPVVFLRSLPSVLDKASPANKAAVVAAVCGAFAVFCGFALYLVFTHAVEEGDAAAKLIGIAVGLCLSMAVAAFGHQLWEAIDDGELNLARPATKTVVATISLLIVFELSASAFEDLARATLGDFDSIKRIAADIAGPNSEKDDAFSVQESERLLPLLQSAARALPHDCPTCVKTAAARLITILPAQAQLDLFTAELRPSDDKLKAFFFGAAASTQDACRRASAFDAIMHPGATVAPATAAEIEACRKQLEGYSQSSKAAELRGWMDGLLADHGLFDDASFKLTATGAPLALGRKLHARLAQQRSACDAILKNVSGRADRTCFGRLQDALSGAFENRQENLERAAPYLQTLASPSTMRTWNRELLSAAFPGVIEPAAMNWFDLLLMFVVWCLTGAVVGINLSWLAVDTDKKTFEALGSRLADGGVALMLAGLSAGAVLITVRIVVALSTLATNPAAVAAGPYNVLPRGLVWLNGSLSVPPYAVMALLVGGALALVVGARRWWLRAAGGAVLAALVLSNLPDLDGVANVIATIEMAWVVPTLGLALLVPYLRRGAKFPWAWGIAALFLAAGLALWEASTHGTASPWRGALVFGGLAAIAGGLWVVSRVSFVDLTPVWAVTVALFLVGGTAAFQEATFNGAMRELHPLMAVGGGGSWYRDVEGAAPGFVAAESAEDVEDSLVLQLWLSGAVGFWLTIALLLTWSLKAGPRPKQDETRVA